MAHLVSPVCCSRLPLTAYRSPLTAYRLPLTAHGYQFAPNCSRVVVVFLMPGMSPWFPFAFRCPILPIPTLTPPSSASLGETKYSSPPVTPPPRPDTERGSCCPVARSTSVVLSFRRATHAPM